MKNKLILLIYFLATLTSYACTCVPPLKLDSQRTEEFEKSKVIITGIVSKLNQKEQKFELKISEVFKGNLKINQDIIGQAIFSCVPFVDKNGEWLIYGNYENGMLTINTCGLSRSLNHPEENRHFIMPKPPPDLKITESDREKLIRKNNKKEKKLAMKELEYELAELRKRK